MSEFVGYRGKPTEPGPYYHGTSSVLDIKDELLTPERTGRQREARTQRRGKIFFTNNIDAAVCYAKLAVKEWGGKPTIYIILPSGRVKQMSNTWDKFGPVFHATEAKVVGTVKL